MYENSDSSRQHPDLTETRAEVGPTRPGMVRRSNDLFFGRDGLRAGWSVLLYFFLFALLGLAGAGLYSATHKREIEETRARAALARKDPAVLRAQQEANRARLSDDTPGRVLATDGGLLAISVLAAFGMAFMERRRFVWYGLWSRSVAKDLALGLLWGAVCMSLLIASLRLAHVLSFDAVRLSAGQAFLSGTIWLAAFLLVGVTEEFLFRGYLQYTFTRGIRGMLPEAMTQRRMWAFWISATLLSAYFLVAHTANPGETPIGLISVFLAGMVFSFALWRTGALWWSIGFHSAWDWCQSFLFGVGDSGTFAHNRLLTTHPSGSPLLSGGATGPEGSLLVLPVFVLIALVIHVTLPLRAQPPIAPLPSGRPAEETEPRSIP